MDWAARLRGFQAAYRGLANDRQAFDAKRSEAAFAAEIEALYTHFVGAFRRYCGNCWHDAFIQLLTCRHMNNKSQFRLLSGTLLHDPVNRDVRYMLTPRRLAEMGDDLALRHLAHNPHAAEYFEKPLPENLGELIAAYRDRESRAAKPPKGRPSKAAKQAKAASKPRVADAQTAPEAGLQADAATPAKGEAEDAPAQE